MKSESNSPKDTETGAFVQRTDKKVDPLQERIDQVVAKAEAADLEADGKNIFHNRLPVRRRTRMRTVKLS
jgi:hypothetical protein